MSRDWIALLIFFGICFSVGGGWPSFHPRLRYHEMVAPVFAVFEGWAFGCRHQEFPFPNPQPFSFSTPA